MYFLYRNPKVMYLSYRNAKVMYLLYNDNYTNPVDHTNSVYRNFHKPLKYLKFLKTRRIFA